jgi:hypothetical protein
MVAGGFGGALTVIGAEAEGFVAGCATALAAESFADAFAGVTFWGCGSAGAVPPQPARLAQRNDESRMAA